MKRVLLQFLVLTFLISWIIWLVALLKAKCILNIPVSSDFLIKTGAFSPSAVGIIMTLITEGRSEAKLLLRSMVKIHLKTKWYLLLFLTLPAVSSAACLLMLLTGNSLPPVQFPAYSIPLVFVYILVLMGPLGEEAGWRGFAMRRLMGSYSPFKSAFILGCVWALWHLPLFFIEGTTQNALMAYGLLPVLICFWAYTVMISVLISLFFAVSNGSTLSAIVFHTMGNLTLGVVPLIFSKTGAVIYLLCLIAAVSGITYKFKNILWARSGKSETDN